MGTATARIQKSTVPILSALLFFLISSCKGKPTEENVEVVDLSRPEKLAPHEFFTQLELTPLKFDSESYPSAVWQLDVMDDKIVIADKSQLIHVFDSEGNYLSCSDRVRGEGPGEYRVLLGHYVNPASHTVTVLDPVGKITFDTGFNFVERRSLPTLRSEKGRMFESGYEISDTLALLLPSGVSEDPHKVYVYDNTGEEIIAEMDYSADVIAPVSMQEHSFFPMESGELLFTPRAYTGYIYRLIPESAGMEKMIKLLYDEKTLSRSDVQEHAGNPAALRQFLLNTDKNLPIGTLVNDRFVIGNIKGGDKFEDFFTVIADRKKARSYRIDNHDGKSYRFPLIMNIDGKHLYGVATKEFIVDNPGLLEGFDIKTKSPLSEIGDEEFVLLRYTLPES